MHAVFNTRSNGQLNFSCMNQPYAPEIWMADLNWFDHSYRADHACNVWQSFSYLCLNTVRHGRQWLALVPKHLSRPQGMKGNTGQYIGLCTMIDSFGKYHSVIGCDEPMPYMYITCTQNLLYVVTSSLLYL